MPRTWLAIALWLLAPFTTEAGVPVWGPDGVSVCGPGCIADAPFPVPDGQGGIYVTWREIKDLGTTGADVYLQRITAAGAVAPGWPAAGVPVCTFPNSQTPLAIALDPDGSALIVWDDHRNGAASTQADIYAQKILSTGAVAPGWSGGGVPACLAPSSQVPIASITSDGEGGAFVVWVDERDLGLTRADVYMQHLTSLGAPSPGWPAGGVPLTVAPGDQVIESSPLLLVPDGSAIAVWTDCRDPDCEQSFGLRLFPDGTPASGWTTDGLLLLDGETRPNIASDGTGGFYLVSEVLYPASSSFQDLFVRRFTFDGSLFPGWPAEGVQVCCPTPGERDRTRIAEDGSGGVLLSWFSNVPGLNVHASRVLSDATLAPGWPFGGVLVSDPAQSSSHTQEMAPDEEGGLFVVWESTDFQASIQHIAPNGEVEPDWPAGGMAVASTVSQFDPRIASDGAGGAIVVWDESGGTGSRLGIFAQRFVDDDATQTRPSLVSAEAEEGLVTLVWYAEGAGGLGATVERRTQVSDWSFLGEASLDGPDGLRYEDRSVTAGERYAYRLRYRDGTDVIYTEEAWVSVPSDLRFALHGFSPNPAIGLPVVSLTLPKAEPARLEVFDLRGRRVLDRDLSSLGPGQHAVTLDGGVRLAPGVYLLRLTQGESVAQTRGVVLD